METGSNILSRRAIRSFSQGEGAEYFRQVKDLPQYEPITQETGLIDLSGSVNNLMVDWTRKYIEKLNADLDIHSTLSYGALCGSEGLRCGVANVYNSFFRPEPPVGAEHVFTTNGVSSAIDMLAWVLADPGDTILIPVPTFFMLDFDLAVRNGVNVMKVTMDGLTDPFRPEAADDFARAIAAAADAAPGGRARAVFICNPQNPQGRCYSREVLLALVDVCQQRGLQLVADEIYGLSHFAGEAEPFTSVMCVTDGDSEDRVHSLWGMSKDMGAGGLRLGFVISRNKTLRNALEKIAWFTWPAAFSDALASRFLNDTTTFAAYVQIYQRRLGHAHQRTTNALANCGIPHQAATAGLFIYLELGNWIHYFAASENPELMLWKYLVDAGVALSPGQFAASTNLGCFRLVFSKDVDATVLAISRIRTALMALESNDAESGDLAD